MTSQQANITEAGIRAWCTDYLARTLQVPASEIEPDAKFARLGLDSATSIFLVVELEEWLGIELESNVVFEHQSIGELARYIVARLAAQAAKIAR